MNARVRVIKKKGRGARKGGAAGGSVGKSEASNVGKSEGSGGKSGDKKEGRATPTRQGSPARQASPARRAAFALLGRVEEDGAFAAPLLAGVAEELRADDRALCYELVMGCLRRQLWLDRLMEIYAGRAASALDAPVRRALRLGLYQLRFLSRIPPSAAVNESVQLMHEARLRSAAAFVNAVLRRATREPERDPAEGINDELERVSVETSHPVWLVERWTKAFGADEARAFAEANNAPAPVSFRLHPARAESAEVLERLRAAGAKAVASKIAPDAWRIEEDGGAEGVALLRALAGEGLIYMQDEASQLVAHVVGARAGELILDACAAPGSKTTHMAALAGESARIIAGDMYEHRLRLVREAAARQDLRNILPIAYDAERALPFADGAFARVLVDAPCTGTGTLRHNPEIRWRIRPEDFAELAARQTRILAEASRTVGAGGRLVYSTCSVEREENEAVVGQFLESHADFKQVSLAATAEAFLNVTGAARTWPHRDDTDGFFVAAFERAG
ncbi:MAG TPA: 16S rRNA (cytosine(967)-C(5))-methyltransferase RsmB [Pyrinomonadaceae bacterium]|jgi:16S rRNA (cytosine967-C5)-methyltransferase|nr:16S rRNA (cytosine(967)-C(5))-methyltransferase RsmB [Pyrinomonadaceae bacterium]